MGRLWESLTPISLCFYSEKSPCRQRPPGTLRRTPVNTLQQHRQLRRADRQLALRRRWPDEPSLFKALGKQAGPLAVPPNDLDQIAATSTKNEKMTRERILLQHPLGQRRQRVEALPHVRDPGGQPDLRLHRNRDHSVTRPLARRSTRSTSKAPLSVRRCPEVRSISIRSAPLARSGSGAAVPAFLVTSTGRNAVASRPGPKRGSPRQRKTMFAFNPFRRATAATEAPGSSVSATTRRLNDVE
jgi:hypothetical protein